jgi:hypothetical protein
MKYSCRSSDFESDENYFRGFQHRYSFPYFLNRFLTDFLHIRHVDFNGGEHLSYLNKTNWPLLRSAKSRKYEIHIRIREVNLLPVLIRPDPYPIWKIQLQYRTVESKSFNFINIKVPIILNYLIIFLVTQ